MEIRDSVKERVKKGAALLDQKVPGWEKKIKVEKLQMAHCSHCMLGQLFGHDVETALGSAMFGLPMKENYYPVHGGVDNGAGYLRGLRILGRKDGADIGCNVASPGIDSFEELRCAWVEEIVERRANETEAVENSAS